MCLLCEYLQLEVFVKYLSATPETGPLAGRGVSRTAVEGLLPHISDGARLDEMAKAVQIGPAQEEAVTHRPTAVLPPAAP